MRGSTVLLVRLLLLLKLQIRCRPLLRLQITLQTAAEVAEGRKELQSEDGY